MHESKCFIDVLLTVLGQSMSQAEGSAGQGMLTLQNPGNGIFHSKGVCIPSLTILKYCHLDSWIALGYIAANLFLISMFTIFSIGFHLNAINNG